MAALRSVALGGLAAFTLVGCRQRGDCDAAKLEAGAAVVQAADETERPAVAAQAIVGACGQPPSPLLRDHLAWKAGPLDPTLSRAEFDHPVHVDLWRQVCSEGPEYLELFRPETGIRGTELYVACGHEALGVLSPDEAAVAEVAPSSWLIFAWMRNQGADLEAARTLTRALMLPGVLPKALDLPEGQRVPRLASATPLPSGVEVRVDALDVYIDGHRVSVPEEASWRQRWRVAFSTVERAAIRDTDFPAFPGPALRLAADASLPAEVLTQLLEVGAPWGFTSLHVVVETPRPYAPLAAVALQAADAQQEAGALRPEPGETLGAFTARAAEALGQPCCVEGEGPGCPAQCSAAAAPVWVQRPSELASPEPRWGVLGTMGELLDGSELLDEPP